jgi:hypothetical protein
MSVRTEFSSLHINWRSCACLCNPSTHHTRIWTSGGLFTLILNPPVDGVVSFKLRQLYPALLGTAPPAPVEWEGGWVGELVWALWRLGKFFPLPAIEPRFLSSPIRNLVAKPDKTYHMADEPMVHVPKMARGKITFARGIHCRPKYFYSFARPAYLYGEECVYKYI